MKTQSQTINKRWHQLETARRQTMKIGITLMALLLTSVVVAVTSAAG